MITLQKMVNDLFENNIEFSVFSNVVGDTTITTIRIRSDTKLSIIYFNGSLCMVKYCGGMITYADSIDFSVDNNTIKLELFLEGTHVGVFLCESC